MAEAPLVVVGLMSGTSMDAVDAAVVEVGDEADGLYLRLLNYLEVPFSASLSARVRAQFDPVASSVDEICEVNALLGAAFAEAAEQALAEAGRQADLVGSHGQTIWHQVSPDHTRSTLQVGEPSVIAERLRTTVVADFRPRDIAAGGQGAPLTGWLDALIAQNEGASRAIQNIGGIGNVTWLPAGARGDWSRVMAFDTGPGNVLIDEAARRCTDGSLTYDAEGTMARQGRIDDDLLERFLQHPYFEIPPPKSTGRELFGSQFLDQFARPEDWRGQRGYDLLATLTALTAYSIAGQYQRFLPQMPDEVYVCGGGARNPVLVSMLRDALGPARIRPYERLGLHGARSEASGIPGSAREAVCFALLAYEAIHGRPNNIPACTGASYPTVLGKIVPGPSFRDLLRRVVSASPRASNHLRLHVP